MSGWIALHRKILESRVFLNPELLKVWVWCLLKATHKEQWVSIKTGKGETEILVKPGTFIFGRNVAAKELKMKSSSVYDRMKKLKNMKNVDIQTNTHYSIVSILNWDTYQKEDMCNQQPNRQATNNQPTTNQQPTNTYNNENNENNVNNENNIKDIVQKPKRKTKIFKKPTIPEIAAECLKRGNNIDPEAFYDNYESKGWLINKTPMKCWKSAMNTWERNDKKQPQGYMSKADQRTFNNLKAGDDFVNGR